MHTLFWKKNVNMNPEIFTCEICKDFFYKKRYLTRHIQRKHLTKVDSQSETKKPETSTICCLEENCCANFRRLQELRNHLQSSHEFELINSNQKLTFSSESEFLNWLADEENKTKSTFNVSKKEKCLGHIYTIFHCNRSGVFKSKAKIHKKRLKAQGSVKVGHYCTASIIKKDFQSHIEILYFSQHYKHKNELKYIPIPKEDRQVIAGKLLAGVSGRRIIQECRIVNNEEVRKNIITTKDLGNIKTQYGIHAGNQNFVGPFNQNQPIDVKDRESNRPTLIKYHEQNKKKLISLSSKISLIPNMEDERAKQIRKHLNAIDHLLSIQITEEQKLMLSVKTCELSNKKIEKQKRFYSTKKQRTSKKPRLSRPSTAEAEAKKLFY